MKTFVKAAGIPVPNFEPVKVGADLISFIQRHGLPVVVKPALGSGSVGVKVLSAPIEVDILLEKGLDEIIEAYVSAVEANRPQEEEEDEEPVEEDITTNIGRDVLDAATSNEETQEAETDSS